MFFSTIYSSRGFREPRRGILTDAEVVFAVAE